MISRLRRGCDDTTSLEILGFRHKVQIFARGRSVASSDQNEGFGMELTWSSNLILKRSFGQNSNVSLTA